MVVVVVVVVVTTTTTTINIKYFCELGPLAGASCHE